MLDQRLQPQRYNHAGRHGSAGIKIPFEVQSQTTPVMIAIAATVAAAGTATVMRTGRASAAALRPTLFTRPPFVSITATTAAAAAFAGRRASAVVTKRCRELTRDHDARAIDTLLRGLRRVISSADATRSTDLRSQ